MYSTISYLCLASIFINTCFATERTLKTYLNLGCDNVCTLENVTNVYIRAEGSTDTLHYLWDFYGNPSLLLALTSPSSQLHIIWNDYLLNKPKSVYFTEEPRYTFGIVIQKLFEYNDINDTGLLDTISDANINVLDTKMFSWIRQSVLNDSKYVELEMQGTNYYDPVTDTMRKGNLQIMLNGFCNLAHSDVMPHMLHSENSTQIDIILNNLGTNASFANSRFALELLLVSENKKTDAGMFVDAKKSLDDEHTPGIFEVIELRTPPVSLQNVQQNSAYLQWRPVSYTTATRDINHATEAMYYRLVNVSDSTNLAKHSLLYAYYGDKMNDMLVEKINISLGTTGDGFYRKTNYSTWTFIIGYGVPPAEQFSYLVIMIISIGLGLPILMMIIVGIYTCLRRIPKRHENSFINS